jgi:hypothetical protein
VTGTGGQPDAAIDDDARRQLADVATWAASAPDRAIDAIGYLDPQLAVDRASGQLADWARSTVVDENTGEPVLAATVLRALGDRAGIEVRYPTANAGLVHVYGYLLSPAPTPYGPKRARWTDGDLARALGHHPHHFQPWRVPAGESLLGRVTASALPIALGEATDHVLLAREDDDGRGGLLRTVVWRSPGAAAGALVYAHVTTRCRLVTAFPVPATPEWLAGLAALPSSPPRARYNAVVTDS